MHLYHLHLEGPQPFITPEASERFFSMSLFTGPGLRTPIAEGRGDFIPVILSDIPNLVLASFPDPAPPFSTGQRHQFQPGLTIRKYIPESFPIGDDGGGHVIFYAKRDSGEGLYHVGFGNLGMEDAVRIADTLGSFLRNTKGIETF